MRRGRAWSEEAASGFPSKILRQLKVGNDDGNERVQRGV